MKKAGRPKSELDLPEGWQKEVLSLYSDGASDVEIKVLIYKWRDSFSNNLWDRWMEEEPIFWETIKKGRQLCEVWWQKQARENLNNREFSYVGWYMNMKNRFGWADKTESKQTVTITEMPKITIDLSNAD